MTSHNNPMQRGIVECQYCHKSFYVETRRIKLVQYHPECARIIHAERCRTRNECARQGVAPELVRCWTLVKDTCEGGEMVIGSVFSSEEIKMGLQFCCYTPGTQFRHYGKIYQVNGSEMVEVKA